MEIEDKNSQEYKNLVAKLPEEYQDKYHVLIEYGAVVILMLCFARRGREGIDKIKKSDLVKKYDEENDYWYWQRVVIRSSKNHK